MEIALRETAIDPTKRLGTPPKERFSPTKFFADQAFAARLWSIIAGCAIVVGLVQPYFIVRAQRSTERVVVLDGAGTFSVSPLLGFEEAKDLHEAMTLWATLAFFSRNPQTLDYPELLQKLYLPEAYTKAQSERSHTQKEFALKNIHQKPEVFKIEVLRTHENQVLAKVEGQLIRSGVFEGQSFTESPKFTLTLTFVRNPDMLVNKRYPLGVWSFDYTVY